MNKTYRRTHWFLVVVCATVCGMPFLNDCHVSAQTPTAQTPTAQMPTVKTESEQVTAAASKTDQDSAANNVTETSKPNAAETPNHNPALTDKQWPLFRGNAQSTGVANTELPDKLEILWEFEVSKGAFEGTPIIVTEKNDAAKKTVFIGDLDGKLFSLDLETGKKRWDFSSEAEIGFMTAPAYRNGNIYIGDIDGGIYCINESGEKVWKFQSEGEINSSPNFYKDNVLVGSQDSHLYALNAVSGTLDWKYESEDQIRCSATVAGNRAFVAGCDGYFHVVDLDSGEEVGHTEIFAPTGATPAALGDLVYFGNEQGHFFAVDWKKIENKWVYSDEEGGNSIRSCAAVNHEHVVFGSYNRTVYSLHPVTGKENWKLRLRAKVESSPVIVGDRVIVASTDGRLFAISLKDGAVIWEKQFNGGFIGSPAVAFGRLVIASDRGVVYCLGKAEK